MGAIVHKGGEPVDVDPTYRRGLRHCPEFAVVAAEVRGGHVDGQVRQRSPEVHERGAVIPRVGTFLAYSARWTRKVSVRRRSREEAPTYT